MKRVILWLVSLILWSMALWSGYLIVEQQDLLSLRLEEQGEGVTTRTVDRITDTYHMAAHEEIGLIPVTAPETGRAADVYGIMVAGDRRLITGYWLTDGSFGLGDAGDCIISEGAAKALFGSGQAAGLTVRADHQQWYVRGVIKTERPVILLPAAKDELLTSLEFSFSDAGDNQGEAEQACYQYGINGHKVILDYRFFSALVRLLLWSPLLMTLIWLKQKKRIVPSDRRHKVMCLALELLFWGGIFLFIFQGIRFPSGYIPAKWSDFAFWSQKWEGAIAVVSALFRSQRMKDLLLRKWLIVCGSLSVGTCFTLFAALNCNGKAKSLGIFDIV